MKARLSARRATGGGRTVLHSTLEPQLVTAPIEVVVEANGGHLYVPIPGAESIAGKRCDGERRRDNERLIIQSQIIVFEPYAPIARKRPLDAASRQPTAVGVAVGIGSRRTRRYISDSEIAVADPAAATLGIEQNPVNSYAESGGQRCHPSVVRTCLESSAGNRRPRTGILIVGEPVKIAFNASHEDAHLVVGTDLAATEEGRIVAWITVIQTEKA